MTLPVTVRAAIVTVGVAASAAVSLADRPGNRLEFSDDNRSAPVIESKTDGQVIIGPGARGDLPFGTEPDWQSAKLRRALGALAIADLNHDGFNDVVLGAYISNNSFPPYPDGENLIYFNDGTGQLGTAPGWVELIAEHTTDVQVGDVNGDGFTDILFVNGGCSFHDSRIYLGSAAGPDGTPDWASNPPETHFGVGGALADVDDDGDLDVVIAGQGDCVSVDPFRPIFMYPNLAGEVATSPTWQSADREITNSVAFGDYDNDGYLDMGTAKWANWLSGVYHNSSGTLETSRVWNTGDDSTDRGVQWGDMDLDGDLDLVLGQDDATQVWANQGDGSFLLYWSSDDSVFHGHNDIRLADIELDGDLDIIVMHHSNGHVRLHLNHNGVFNGFADWTYDGPGVGTGLAIGDINGDGMPDIVAGHNGDVTLRVFYNQLTPGNPCPADLTGDEQINVFDLLDLLGAWGPCPGCGADLTGDEQVNVFDLLDLLGAWGPCR